MSINPLKSLRLKTKNYQKVAIIEILLIFFVLTMGDLASIIAENMADKLVTSILLILEVIYLILLLQLAWFLNPSKRINTILKVAIGIIFLLSVIALNPFIEIVDNKIPWLIGVHIFLCAIECFIIALGLQDIYSQNLHITERLWGSVAMYLLIALGWGSFYEIIILIQPVSLGVELVACYQSYSESLYFSLCAISGTGSVYSSPTHLIRNLALIEAVWGVLFLVMLIGRLFSLPYAEK